MSEKSEAQHVHGGGYMLHRRLEAVRGPFSAAELVRMARRGELLLMDLVGAGVGDWVPVARVPELRAAVDASEAATTEIVSLLRSPDSGNRLLGIAKFKGTSGCPHVSLLAALLGMLSDASDDSEPDAAARCGVCESLIALGGSWATIGRVHHRSASIGDSVDREESLRLLQEYLGVRGAFEIGVYLVRQDRFLETFVEMDRSVEAWHSAVVESVPAVEVLQRLHQGESSRIKLRVSLIRRAIRERDAGAWKGPWPQLVRIEGDGLEHRVMLDFEGDGGELNEAILESAAAMIPVSMWSDIELQGLQEGLHCLPDFLARSGVLDGGSPKLTFRDCGQEHEILGMPHLTSATVFQAVHFNSCGRLHSSLIRALVSLVSDELRFDGLPELPDLSGSAPGAVGKIRSIAICSVPMSEVPAWIRNGEGSLSETLQSLEIRDCRVLHLGDEPWNLPKLEQLDLSGNSIVTLGSALTELSALANLDLRENRIQRIGRSQWPKGAAQLDGPNSSIVLARNPLVECEVVPYAAELNLDELPLPDLPRPYGQTRFIETLLAPAGIRNLNERLAQCNRLTDLVVSETCLEELPAWLWRLPRLGRVQANKLRNLRLSIGSHPMDPEHGSSRTLQLEGTSFAPWTPVVNGQAGRVDGSGIDSDDESLLDLDLDLELEAPGIDDTLDLDSEESDGIRDIEEESLSEAEDLGKAADGEDGPGEAAEWENASFDISLDGAIIAEFPEWLRGIPLSSLDITRTSIQRLPDWASGWAQLTELKAEEACLSSLPSDLDRWRACEKISISGSAVEALPDSIGGLARLRRLEMRGCRIRELPSGLADCQALETLDLDETLITDLPDWLGDLNGLQYLMVSAPSLSRLPESLGRCAALVELRLAQSGLETLPRSIGKLAELASLDLSNSAIKELPAELEQCMKLRDIRLAGVRTLSRRSLDLLSRLAKRVKIHASPNSLIGMHIGVGTESH
jgi:Leucine-rich repeat (LRR) protein